MSFNPQRLQLDTAFAHIDKGNYEAAAPVLRRFAEQGDIDAQYQLAFMLEHGLGVKTDLEGAVHWYAKAAEQGDLAAQFNLAECLEDGVGTAQDYVQAAFSARTAIPSIIGSLSPRPFPKLEPFSTAILGKDYVKPIGFKR